MPAVRSSHLHPVVIPHASPRTALVVAAAAPAPERVRWPRVLCLCSLMFGISVTEWVSLHVLPLTLRNFTTDPAIIGLLLALNPLFGFLIQPAVGILSDRIWTPLGRRSVFLIGGSLVVATCLALVPLLQVFWQLVVVVVVYQIFQDVLCGSDNPLLADLIPVRHRAFVQGALTVTSQLAGALVLQLGLPSVHRFAQTHGLDLYGAPVYWAAAGLQVLCVFGAAFFLAEKRVPSKPRPRLTLRRYVADLTSNSMLVRLALVNFLRAFQGSAANGFLVLFVTVTLAATPDHYGETAGWMPIVGIAAAALAGLAGGHLPRPIMLKVAFMGFIAAYALGFFSGNLESLIFALLLMGFFQSFVEVTFKAFVTEFLPCDIVGQLTGAMNICFATGRTLGYICVGLMVHWAGNNYRIAWLIAIAFAVATLAVLATVQDPRTRPPAPHAA